MPTESPSPWDAKALYDMVHECGRMYPDAIQFTDGVWHARPGHGLVDPVPLAEVADLILRTANQYLRSEGKAEQSDLRSAFSECKQLTESRRHQSMRGLRRESP